MVLNLLPIPGASVPCERAFSRAGLIVDDLRSQLNPVKVNFLLFLQNNADLWTLTIDIELINNFELWQFDLAYWFSLLITEIF